MSAQHGVFIEHSKLDVHRSPSGLPTLHITSSEVGARNHFVGLQVLMPGDQVYPHTHPVEETLVILKGAGSATFGDDRVEIDPGHSLFIPAGVVHGFSNPGPGDMEVLIVFPVPYFAETLFAGSTSAESTVTD